MLRSNQKKLVEFALEARPRYPRASPWQVGHDGRPFMLPRTGGITYSVKVGDSCYGWMADHAEPCVTVQMAGNGSVKSDENRALNQYVCVGNEAVVLSGAAKGARGVVTGKHGGVEHVIVDFPTRALDKLSYADRIRLRAVGQGLEFTGHPDVRVFNAAPKLIDAWGLRTSKGALVVPVAAEVPAVLMGSGLGSTEPWHGDYDIQTSDPELLAAHGLDKLRLGDIVAICDYDSSWGWSYKPGRLMVGCVVHGDSFKSGHGPGVMSLLSGPVEAFTLKRSDSANVGRYLKAGRYRRRSG